MSVLTELLPTFVETKPEAFDLFAVLHHGMREGSSRTSSPGSNASHQLGDRFLRCFIDELNLRLVAKHEPTVPLERFVVEQEQNVRTVRKGAEIADLVLAGERTAIVVENYFIFDGHDHDCDAYLEYGRALCGGGRLWCCGVRRLMRAGSRTAGRGAAVITYPDLLVRLFSIIDADPDCRADNPEPYWFFSQMSAQPVCGEHGRCAQRACR